MRHGILGPGGVGGLIGAVLADAGEDVILIIRPTTESNYPPDIELESPFRNLRAAVSVSANLKSPLDVLWIALKATQLHAATERIPAHLGSKAIVPLLNGIDHVELLRKRFGEEPVIPATIAVECERVAPGKIIHRSPFVRLSVLEKGHDKIAVALQIFHRFGFECVVVDDEATLLWDKLVLLAPVALSTAAARTTIGEVLRDPANAERLESLVREACAVATRAGARIVAGVVFDKIKNLPAGMRSSMERDITDGNPPELDAIAGPILRGAAKYGIALETTPELVQTLGKTSIFTMP